MPTIYCSLCQEQLPDTGVPVARHRFDHMREKFEDYVKNRTLQNWKFWIVSLSLKRLNWIVNVCTGLDSSISLLFSLILLSQFSVIIQPLFESFNGTVSTTNNTELCETTMQWLDRYCALPVLRPSKFMIPFYWCQQLNSDWGQKVWTP